MRRIRGQAVASPGIAQATYDAAVAKLVTVSAWVDLTAAITTACAGAAASDPDSLAAGLTVGTTTGTFDGETIPCNEFAWTTHTTVNDGHGETLNYDLGTIATHIPSYDPALHILHIEACLVATGTLNSTTPQISVALAASGTLNATNATAIGFAISTATSVQSIRVLTSTASASITAGDPTARVARAHMRSIPLSGASRRLDLAYSELAASTPENALVQSNGTFSNTDKLILCLGQGTTTAAPFSGGKARFRVRILAKTNLDFSDLDLGVQA